MKVSDFKFDLPDELIARFPLEQRSASRLLCLDGDNGETQDRQFADLLDLLQPGDLLVFNNTKVIPARLFGQKASGGKIEMLLERVLEERRCLVHLRSSRSPKPGARLTFEGGIEAEVVGRQDALFELALVAGGDSWLQVLEQHGHMPLPPYMQREDQSSDRDRYQTVYAQQPGAVAAPTAGLHFDEPLLAALKDKDVEFAYVTLHVGAGTFQPVKVDSVQEHQMHSEWLDVGIETIEQILKARQRGSRVVAVGTTSVRSLESTAQQSLGKGQRLAPFSGETDIFIYPGYRFLLVDAMITNFHLPESTLIMLVSAFAGQDHVLAAYRHAVEQQYRFFSYGDAMFITRQNLSTSDSTEPNP